MSIERVAVITGAACGIGRVTAITLASKGYCIAAIDQSGEELHSLAEFLESQERDCFVYELDVSKEKLVFSSVSEILKDCGRIDVLANIAGIIKLRKLENTAPEDFKKIIDVNLYGVFLMMKAVIPYMRDQGGGSIVNIGSISAHEGYSYHAAYSASKSGVLRLTEAAAEELREDNIRVNAVCPSGVATDLFGKEMRKLDRSKWLQPQDIANVIAYLFSDEAEGITGACIDVKGMHLVSVEEVKPYLDLGE